MESTVVMDVPASSRGALERRWPIDASVRNVHWLDCNYKWQFRLFQWKQQEQLLVSSIELEGIGVLLVGCKSASRSTWTNSVRVFLSVWHFSFILAVDSTAVQEERGPRKKKSKNNRSTGVKKPLALQEDHVLQSSVLTPSLFDYKSRMEMMYHPHPWTDFGVTSSGEDFLQRRRRQLLLNPHLFFANKSSCFSESPASAFTPYLRIPSSSSVTTINNDHSRSNRSHPASKAVSDSWLNSMNKGSPCCVDEVTTPSVTTPAVLQQLEDSRDTSHLFLLRYIDSLSKNLMQLHTNNLRHNNHSKWFLLAWHSWATSSSCSCNESQAHRNNRHHLQEKVLPSQEKVDYKSVWVDDHTQEEDE
jgi:hypothetical protein